MRRILVFLWLMIVGLTACDRQKAVEARQVAEKSTAGSGKEYTLIPSESYIDWRATHLGGLNPRYGKVYLDSASVWLEDTLITAGRFVVRMNSITVESFPDDPDNERKLTSHLKSADFFDVEHYPYAYFTLTSPVATAGEGQSRIMTGNLQIKDSIKNIRFPVYIQRKGDTLHISFEKFRINRQDWGINYHSAGTPGIPKDFLIDDEVEFRVNVKLAGS